MGKCFNNAGMTMGKHETSKNEKLPLLYKQYDGLGTKKTTTTKMNRIFWHAGSGVPTGPLHLLVCKAEKMQDLKGRCLKTVKVTYH